MATRLSLASEGDGLSLGEWEAVLHLLAALAVADGRLLESEVNAMGSALADVAQAAGLQTPFTLADVRGWIAENASHYRVRMSGEAARTWLGAQLIKLADSPHRAAIYKGLEHVAVADMNLHKSEFDAMMVAAAIWDLTPSTQVLAQRYA